jgi:hypothetical protein
MNQGKRQYNRGLISAVILVVVALIILGYFRINVRAIMSAPGVQDNLKYAWEIFISGFTGIFQILIKYRQAILSSIPH